MRGSFAALLIRNFAILWAGSLSSFTAFFMSTIVQAIVAYDLTGRNSAVGLVLLGQGAAMAILGPLGGAMADRASKRLISTLGQAVVTGVFLVFGLLLAFDLLRLWHLVAGAFLIGMTFAFNGPARQAWVVDLVVEELRPNAVALNQVALNAARIWAPALAGVLVSWALIGAAGAYLTMAALSALTTASMALLPPSSPRATGRERSVLHDMTAGFTYVWRQPRLRWMLVLFFSIILLSLSSTTLLPGLLDNQLGVDIERIGILNTVNAVGGLAASLAVASIAGSPRALTVYGTGAALSGVALLALGLSPAFLIAFVPMFLLGLGTGAFQTLNSAVIVMEAEPAYYGRVISLTSLAFAGFMLAGYPVGVAADAFGERVTLAALGLITLAITAIVWPLIARAGPARPHAAAPPVTVEPSPVPAAATGGSPSRADAERE